MAVLNEVFLADGSNGYSEFMTKIQTLVKSGDLKELGPDKTETKFYFTELYEDKDGQVWKLAHPDQATRGYFKKFNRDVNGRY